MLTRLSCKRERYADSVWVPAFAGMTWRQFWLKSWGRSLPGTVPFFVYSLTGVPDCSVTSWDSASYSSLPLRVSSHWPPSIR